MQDIIESGTATNMMPARAIIVEDELHARRYLRGLLEDEPRIDLVAESPDGADGARQIEKLHPHIVFVDIQMPSLDGFGMIARVGAARLPLFVFVTGYLEYAAQAFEVEAVDYLCKPFEKERLTVAVDRALRRLHAIPAHGCDTQRLPRLRIKHDGQITWVPVSEIIWLEAANKYVVVHTAAGSYVLRDTIQSLENRLDPREFVRTHRSALVRKAAIRGLQPHLHGDYIVRFADGTEAPLSRGFRASFFRAMLQPVNCHEESVTTRAPPGVRSP